MISLEQARALVDEYAADAGAAWFDEHVHEAPKWWFFRCGYIGSVGIFVDKDDGRLEPVGSALTLEECFWGYDRGFRGDSHFRIVRVYDHERTQEFLRCLSRANPFSGEWPFRDGIPDLSHPPIDFGAQPSLWLKIPQFREIEHANWFEYEVRDCPFAKNGSGACD